MPKSSDHDPALDERTMLISGSLAELQAALSAAAEGPEDDALDERTVLHQVPLQAMKLEGEARRDVRNAPEPPSLLSQGMALPADPFDEPTTILDRSTLDALLSQPLQSAPADPALEETTDVERLHVGLDEETVLVDREDLAALLLAVETSEELSALAEVLEVGDEEDELLEIATGDVQALEEASGEIIALSDFTEDDSSEILALGDDIDELDSGSADEDLGLRSLTHRHFDVMDIQERVRRVVPAAEPHRGHAEVEVFDVVSDALVPHEDDVGELDDVSVAPAGFVLLADGEQLADEEQTRIMEALNPRVFGGVSAFPFAMAPGLLADALPHQAPHSQDESDAPPQALETQPLLCHDDVESFPFGATRAERKAWRRSVAH